MNKKMRELHALIVSKTAEAQGFMSGETKDLDKATALMDEVDALQKEYDLEERVMKAGKATVPTEPEAPKTEDAFKKFADAARARFKTMNEGTPADGGYTVPQDIQTKINEYKQERFSLATLIDRETVTAPTGSRVFKKRAQNTGFTEVGESGKITKKEGPQFEKMDYSVKKYAGYIPATNELLADSDAAISTMLINWLGEESIATENAQILAKINTKEATALTGIKDIKKAVNVTLAAFAGSVVIVTNSDGLQYLDTLEDKNGRPLLSPDPTKPMEMALSVGARSIPVKVIPNNVLATADGKVPFIIGDLREYVKMFDRAQLTISVSDVAAIGDLNAYEQDLTIFRGIMRADFRVKDAEAIVRGELTVTA